MARLAGQRFGWKEQARGLPGFCGLGEEPRFYRRRRARHGRIEPRSGSDRGNLRATARLPEIARAGFDRSRAGSRDGQRGQHGEDAVHRLQQVRRHHRAECDEGLFLRRGEQGGRRRQGRRAFRCGDRSRFVAGEGREGAGLCPHLPRRPDHRRALFGAVAIRAGAGRGGRRRSREGSRSLALDGAVLRTGRAAAGKPRRATRARDGHRRPGGPRQGHHPVVEEDRRFRRLGRTADRGIDRQGRQGADPDRRRAARRTRRLRQGSFLHRPSHRRRNRRQPRRQARRAGKGRTSGRSHRDEIDRSHRPGILPLRDRHGRRRRRPRHQSFQPARRRGGQDQDARVDHRIRKNRHACRRKSR